MPASKKGSRFKAAQAASDRPANGSANSLRRTIAEWTATLLVFLFGTTTLVQGFVIPTGSMEDTLLIGDHLFVDKLAYAPPDSLSKHLLPYGEIERGDIVVFRFPPDIAETYVKRAIGLPGDRVRIVEKQVVVNGIALQEPYVVHKTDFFDSYRDYFPSEPNLAVSTEALEMLEKHVRDGEVVVPPEHYFMLGDNRDYSLDSRYWGFVPSENIVGKPWFIYWSYDAPTEYLDEPGVHIDYLFDLAENFFTKTRWERTFQTVKARAR